MGQAEMSALASRLRNRADSVLFRDQPEQVRDLHSAAGLIDELVRLRAEFQRIRVEIQRLLSEVRVDAELEHLRQLLGGL